MVVVVAILVFREIRVAHGVARRLIWRRVCCFAGWQIARFTTQRQINRYKWL